MAKQADEALGALTFNINYHYAHAINYGQKISVLDIINPEKGVVKINKALYGNDILVKFSYKGIKTILNKEKTEYNGYEIAAKDNLALEIDTYSGTVAIKYTIPRDMVNGYCMHANDDPYVYDEKIGYSETVKNYLFDGTPAQLEWVNNYKPADDFGYIIESPLRMATILFKGLAFVDNLQKGVLKFRTSSYDLNGYVVQLFPEGILEITQLADCGKTLSLENEKLLKELSEEKEDNSHLPESAETSVDLLGGNNEEDLAE